MPDNPLTDIEQLKAQYEPVGGDVWYEEFVVRMHKRVIIGAHVRPAVTFVNPLGEETHRVLGLLPVDTLNGCPTCAEVFAEINASALAQAAELPEALLAISTLEQQVRTLSEQLAACRESLAAFQGVKS
ncbi:hypothetical protein SH668x_001256 [Planctomicrobium sp. SH668]|uniref:hypothetical protein n=1 Tax=Planctomicrobium sp. SH668 TaxID=3448126 RepID=UPI003F5B56DD